MTQEILFCGYRDWAIRIYDALSRSFKGKLNLVLIKTQEEFEKTITARHPGLIFFVGWSWIIDASTVSTHHCICLHPSPLPKYRGGSPLQHQIINGEPESAVSLFEMNASIDKGPLVWQESFSLDGDLNDLLERMTTLGIKGIQDILESFIATGTYPRKAQDESKATTYKRRTPDQSEIAVSDFAACTAKQLHDKIRALQDPYPNAFIVCKDGTKLYLQKSRTEDKK